MVKPATECLTSPNQKAYVDFATVYPTGRFSPAKTTDHQIILFHRMQHPPEQFIGTRVKLRRATPEDTQALFLAASEPEVVRYMDWPAPGSPSKVKERLEGAKARWESETEYQWVIQELLSGTVVGTISFRPNGHAVDFGYFLARAHWGKGLAADTTWLIVNWLRAQPEILRIWATADAENFRSHRLLERLGLRREGVLRMATYRPNIGGAPRDTALYAWCKGDEYSVGRGNPQSEHA